MMGREWWSPREIKFTIHQVLWALENADILREGRWPPDPTGSGYVDLKAIKIKGGKEAYYIKPIEVIGEIETRMEKCGIDGLILEALESWGKSISSLANYLDIPEWSIEKRRGKALSYVASGSARRWHTTKKRSGETYTQFKQRGKK